MEVSEFWHNARGPQLPQNIKNLQMGYFCNSFKYFLKFSTSGSNFSKKCKGGDFEVCGVIDQVDHGESAFSRAKISVAMGVTRPIFGVVTYVWGLNIRGKFQGRSSRASYFCQVRACCHFGVLRPRLGRPLAPSLTPVPKIFAALQTA